MEYKNVDDSNPPIEGDAKDHKSITQGDDVELFLEGEELGGERGKGYLYS